MLFVPIADIALYIAPSLFIPCGTAKFSELSLTHINVQIVFLRWDLSKSVQEGSMQICNATYDRQLDLLEPRRRCSVSISAQSKVATYSRSLTVVASIAAFKKHAW